MEIYKANECGKKPLTWGQTRSMTVTNRVSNYDFLNFLLYIMYY